MTLSLCPIGRCNRRRIARATVALVLGVTFAHSAQAQAQVIDEPWSEVGTPPVMLYRVALPIVTK
jgi:hypothetical protein